MDPDGESFNQIDRVLVSRRRQSSLLNVRTYRGANIDSDHYLVGLVIRCRIAHPRANGGGENTQPRLNTDSLRDIAVQQEFKTALEESLLPEDRYETASERWNALKTKIINCARNILPPRRGNIQSGWFDDDKWPNVRILHTEQCSNGIERGHAQRNIHGLDAKRKEFTAPRSMLWKSKTCGNSSKPERRTDRHESFTKR